MASTPCTPARARRLGAALAAAIALAGPTADSAAIDAAPVRAVRRKSRRPEQPAQDEWESVIRGSGVMRRTGK
mgnify:CR=1 FL=1